MKLRYILFVLTTVLFFSACRKDEIIETTVTEIDIPKPTKTYLVTVVGFVTDESGNPIVEAIIKSPQEETTTNEDGFYSLKTKLSDNRPVITASKYGFFESYAMALPSESGPMQVSLQLLERTLTDNFSASTGGIVQTNAGATIDFSANSIVDENGAAYSGEVQVYARYYDPTEETTRSSVASNLIGLDNENNQQLLESYGMLNVELESSSGEKLQISQPTQISLPIPSTLMSSAPQEIPLWHYDTANDLWIEEGSASIENGKYVGDVDHFSLWNCDVPQEFVAMKGQFNIDNLSPELQICVTNLSNGQKRCLITQLNGSFFGYVPKNQNLLIEAYESNCGEVIYSANKGPYERDFLIKEDLTGLSPIEWHILTGSAINCNNEPVSNGWVFIIKAFGKPAIIPINENGNFEGMVTNCISNNYNLQAMDISGLSVGSIEQFSLPIPPAGIEISACSDSVKNNAILSYNNGSKYIFKDIKVEQVIQGANLRYNFTFTDQQQNGSVDYVFSLTIFDSSDPEFGFTFSCLAWPNGLPDIVHDIQPSGLTILQKNSEDGNPEGIVSYTFFNCRIKENTFYFNGEFEITGILE